MVGFGETIIKYYGLLEKFGCNLKHRSEIQNFKILEVSNLTEIFYFDVIVLSF